MLDEEKRDEQYSEGTEHIKPEVKSNSEIPQENTEGEALNNDHQLEYPDIEGIYIYTFTQRRGSLIVI